MTTIKISAHRCGLEGSCLVRRLCRHQRQPRSTTAIIAIIVEKPATLEASVP
jgi:hypothetical protein